MTYTGTSNVNSRRTGFVELLIMTLCFAILLAGCERERLTPLIEGDKILAFGDSLTKGIGVLPSQSYPTVLSKLTGFTVINSGVSGELSFQGRRRLPKVLSKHKPALMVLLHGGNDVLKNRPLSKTRRDLAAMITMARDVGTQVVLIGVPEKTLNSDSAAIYKELAKQFDLVFEDDIIADLIRSPSMKSDRIHFNVAGYRRLAETIRGALDKGGAI